MTILDQTLRIVRRQFEGNDVIRDVPLHKTIGEVLHFVSENYFDPPLGVLEPYEYDVRQGTGLPRAIAPETQISTLRKRQAHRRVGLSRLSINGMAELSMITVLWLMHCWLGQNSNYVTQKNWLLPSLLTASSAR